MAGTIRMLETEAGLIFLDGGEVAFSLALGRGDAIGEVYGRVGEELKRRRIERVAVVNEEARDRLSEIGIQAEILDEEERGSLDTKRLALMVKAGFAQTEDQALTLVRERALKSAEKAISEESSREDLHLVHAIQSLDEIDRTLNITQERVFEWYSLHFPELPPIIQDNLALAKLVIEIGRRDQFDEETLKGRGLSDRKVEAIITARDRSKGGSISDKDMSRVRAIGTLALGMGAEREKLAEYVESAMKKISPNVSEVAGSTIGARLIARAGGLDRLARLPASTIQILGAEKALFRALRTGARPPKHGILFQHEAVHTAPKWQRGKIARTLANKIAIAARIDYYRGERDGSLTGMLEKRLTEIRLKYKEPRKSEPPKGKRDLGKPFLRGKRRKEKRRH